MPDAGTIISLGSNLSDDTSCLLDPLTDIVNSANIDLGPLADNGGPMSDQSQLVHGQRSSQHHPGNAVVSTLRFH